MRVDIVSFADEFKAAENLETLEAIFGRAISALGISQFTYGSVSLPRARSSNRVVLSTYHPEWIERYQRKGYERNDPIVHQAIRAILPYDWTTIPSQKLQKDQIQIIMEADDFGIAEGASVPVRGPNGEFSLISLASDQGKKEWRILYRTIEPDLIALCTYFHARIADLTAFQEEVVRPLTPRQKEVMTWTASGKTAWEISEILKLSEKTVVEYINGAKQRMGVNSKTHAVVKAIMSGQILV